MTLQLHLKAEAGAHKSKKGKGCEEDGEEGNLGNSRVMNRISEVPMQAALLSSTQSLEYTGHGWSGAAEMSLERWFQGRLGRVSYATLIIWTLTYTQLFLTFFGKSDESYDSSFQKYYNNTYAQALHSFWVLIAHPNPLLSATSYRE